MLPVIAGATRVLSVGSKAASAKRALNAVHPPPSKPKLGGVMHWFFFGIVLILDLVSILCELILLAGVGISATGVGAIVGLPLAGVAWLIQALAGTTATVVSVSYFWINKVRMTPTKILLHGMAFILNKVPILSFIPMNTIAFVATTLEENSKRKGGLIGGVLKIVT